MREIILIHQLSYKITVRIMHRPPSVNTTRYSVNTSQSQFQMPHHDTATKAPSKRFSYQDAKHNHTSLLKENIVSNQKQPAALHCLNHPGTVAPYSALQNTNDPMHLCERCAIMVASKGFEISKVSQNNPAKQDPPHADFKTSINATFNSIKTAKYHTTEKISAFQLKLQTQEQQIQEYFDSITEFINKKKEFYLKEICKNRKELEMVRHQANKYYMTMLQKVRQISKESSTVNTDISAQFSYYLQQLSKGVYKIPTQKITCKVDLRPLNETIESLQTIFSRSKELKTKRQLKQECEKDNSSIRSLQLSFEQNNEDTLRQGNDEGKAIVQSNISSNLLNSLGVF